jgi:hypothetical protein
MERDAMVETIRQLADNVDRARPTLVSASKAMLTAIGEIEWLHSRAGITSGDCACIKLLRTSIDEVTDLIADC